MAVSLRDALTEAIREYVGAVWEAEQSHDDEAAYGPLVDKEERARQRVASLLAQVPLVFEAREVDGD